MKNNYDDLKSKNYDLKCENGNLLAKCQRLESSLKQNGQFITSILSIEYVELLEFITTTLSIFANKDFTEKEGRQILIDVTLKALTISDKIISSKSVRDAKGEINLSRYEMRPLLQGYVHLFKGYINSIKTLSVATNKTSENFTKELDLLISELSEIKDFDNQKSFWRTYREILDKFILNMKEYLL